MTKIENILQQIAIRAKKQILGEDTEKQIITARIDAQIICGDYITYKVSTIGFNEDTPCEDILESAAGKQALYQELCKMYGVQ